MKMFCDTCAQRKPVYQNGKQVRCQQCGRFHGRVSQFAPGQSITAIRPQQEPNPHSRRQRRLRGEEDTPTERRMTAAVKAFLKRLMRSKSTARRTAA